MILRILMYVVVFFSSNVLAKAIERPLYLELGVGGAFNSSKQSGTESGFVSSKAKPKFTAVTSLLLGYKHSEQMRFDLDVSYLPKWRVTAENKAEPSSYHADLSALMATINGYYDFPAFPKTRLRPYVMAGLGASRNEVGDVDEYVSSELSTKYYGHSQYNFAWRVGAGISCDINERAALNFGYSFASLGSVSTKSSSSAETHSGIESMILGSERLHFKNIYSHQLLVGVRIGL